ncbi:hypothetical protein TanjilG_11937 [Lupinus angustifolius]|uniref:BAG domain-containing protein n=1 Tax=Lupinus angustifolius TaxID=3871 RepID=A0A1J7H370_LUPAN|nr:hypothetical protein TanjilG_11937 [Lupinus angustifolius]
MMHFNNNSCFYRTPCSISSQPKKKVVSIPVHFVESERTRNNSAIKIQKVVRGFLVRNSMKRIKCIRVELEKIEDKVCVEETMELIMREGKERVKFSESIMNLVLKLDNVRVLDYYSGVRGYRKSVIQKAIALQELIDQIQMVGPTHHDQNQSTQVDPDVRDSYLVKCEGDVNAQDSYLVKCEGGVNAQDSYLVKCEDGVNAQDSYVVKCEDGVNARDSYLVKCEDDVSIRNSYLVKSEDNLYTRGSYLVKSEDDAYAYTKNREDLMDNGVGEESVGTSMVEEVEENCLVKEEVDQDCENKIGKEVNYENNKNKELLERMVEDNERMMNMMAQLFERNEMQTKLLSSLSQRVEQLERAYACDKLRKKKRRNVDAKHK